MNPKDIFGKINPPPELDPYIRTGNEGAGAISLFINNLISLIFVIGGVIFVVMIVWGALELILSGGNKEGVANARNRIIYAIIGIAFLAISFAIMAALGEFLGFKFFLNIPWYDIRRIDPYGPYGY